MLNLVKGSVGEPLRVQAGPVKGIPVWFPMAEERLQRKSRVGNVAGDAMHRDAGSSPSPNSLSLGASRGPREVAQWNVSERLAIKGPAGSGKEKAWNLSYSINAPMERTILSLPSSSAKQMVFYSWDSVAEKTQA